MNLKRSGTERLIICDASPIILLAKISCLPLLFEIAEEIWVPDTVWNEVTAQGDRPEVGGIRELLGTSVRVSDPHLRAAYSLLVDSGEAAALALATQSVDPCLLMDDRKGRALAAATGLRSMGTLGLLVRAKKAGLIPSLKPLFDRLKTEHWFIAPSLIDAALKAAGEE